MEILVYIDQEDKDLMVMVERECKLSSAQCTAAKNLFWHGMIDKYPILKNRRISVNIADGYIFQWASAKDLEKANLGHHV
jgi:hypothetical protein